MSNGRRWFLAFAATATGAHLLLPPGLRAYAFVLAAPLTLLPVGGVLRRARRGARLPWALLLVAMSVLSLADALFVAGGPAPASAVELLITLGSALVLAAAISLVLARGRNDIGGMLDVAVAAIGLGGVLWTALLEPRLRELHAPAGEQISILVSLLVLTGVLGALLRLWIGDGRAGGRPGALGWLLVALGFSLAGDVVMVITDGRMMAGRGGPAELLIMIGYVAVGWAMLQPSVLGLLTPGRAPVDQLSYGRLVLLGFVMMMYPVAGGVRTVLGLAADGPLLLVGSLLITPLVLIRVGRLARQRQQAELLLRHQATHDQLTGLPNRAELLTRLAAALDAEACAGTPAVVLLFCDLNGFKQVNDRLGHEAGDRLLVEVAARIRAGLRDGETLARYGGDEFLLLGVEPGHQEEAADRLSAHVAAVLAEPVDLTPDGVVVGASVGVAISDGSLGPDELISMADRAMYRVKQPAGRR